MKSMTPHSNVRHHIVRTSLFILYTSYIYIYSTIVFNEVVFKIYDFFFVKHRKNIMKKNLK